MSGAAPGVFMRFMRIVPACSAPPDRVGIEDRGADRDEVGERERAVGLRHAARAISTRGVVRSAAATSGSLGDMPRSSTTATRSPEGSGSAIWRS
jgi:hypothetical protein